MKYFTPDSTFPFVWARYARHSRGLKPQKSTNALNVVFDRTSVQRQLLLPLLLPHLRMLPAILRMIVPAVWDESRAGGTTAGNRPLGGLPWTGSTPRHAACSDLESAGRSPHDGPPTAPVHPPTTCRVVARADRCSRCSRVRYVTV